MRVPRLLLTSLAAATVALTGCSDPYAKTGPSVTATQPSRVVPAAASSRARDVVRRFAMTAINWTFPSLPANRTRLAAQATGALHAQLLREAAHARADAERRVSDQANAGTVLAVTPAADGDLYVITRETARFGTEAGQSAYVVYWAAVTRTPAGLRLTAWRALT